MPEPTEAANRHRPLRLLYLSWRDREHPEAGGSETFVERTGAALTDLGNTVTVFTSAFPGAAPVTRHGAVRVIRRGGRFTCYPRALAHLLTHRHDYDAVIDVQNGVPFWSPLVARVPVINVLHHVHRDQWPVIFGPRVGRFGWLLESRVAPLVYRSCRYVTVSEATRADLADLGIDPSRVDIVYSGNDLPDDLDSYRHLPRTREPSIVVLGRLVPHKQIEVAIDTVAALSGRFPELRLEIVGTGYWRDTLLAHARAAGVADRVTFHGWVDERTKHRLLAQAWLLLMPSHKEGWGLTIVEAGLHGTPALAFAHAGGPSESILDGLTGVLCRDVPDLQRQVADLLQDPQRRADLGAMARSHARRFDWSTSGRRLEDVLRAELGMPRRPEPQLTPSQVPVTGNPPDAGCAPEPVTREALSPHERA